MNILLVCFILIAGAAARRVPRQYDVYPYSFGDYYPQLPFQPAAYAQETYPHSGLPTPFATATCKLIPAAGQQVSGEIFFSQANSLSPVEVTGTIFGLTPGLHGFHIHQNGNTSDDCKGAGGHFNPANNNHGAPEDAARHAGDLGNIVVDDQGFTSLSIVDHEISLVQNNPRQIVGRAVVVHAKEDDLGKGNNAESLKTGNAGSRVACCVIEMPTYKK